MSKSMDRTRTRARHSVLRRYQVVVVEVVDEEQRRDLVETVDPLLALVCKQSMQSGEAAKDAQAQESR